VPIKAQLIAVTVACLLALQVRSVCVTDKGAVVSGSRDKAVKLWLEDPGQLQLALDTTFVRKPFLMVPLLLCQLQSCCCACLAK
jgi:hypothetical protein